jgi:hypothetical protein
VDEDAVLLLQMRDQADGRLEDVALALHLVPVPGGRVGVGVVGGVGGGICMVHGGKRQPARWRV